jgi:uncharacterized protein YcnI
MTRSRKTERSTSTLAALASIALVLLIPAIAFGHAVVFPRTSTTGAYEKYVLRVPNERDVPTLQVELRFPAEVRVVSFNEVAGWKLRVLTDSAQRIVGAVWTGVLPKERFVEFPFVAVNPKTDATLTWPTYQTYEGGERVEWTGPDSSKTPVSATVISASSAGQSSSSAAFYLSIAAAVLSLLSLGLGLRHRSGVRSTM